MCCDIFSKDTFEWQHYLFANFYLPLILFSLNILELEMQILFIDQILPSTIKPFYTPFFDWILFVNCHHFPLPDSLSIVCVCQQFTWIHLYFVSNFINCKLNKYFIWRFYVVAANTTLQAITLKHTQKKSVIYFTIQWISSAYYYLEHCFYLFFAY